MTDPGITVAKRFTATGRGVEMAVPVTILVLLVVGAVSSPEFLTVGNALNVLTSASIVGIIALGMTFVVIAGGWADLSVPAVIATGAIVMLTLQSAIGTPLAILVAVLVCAVAGMLNGFLIGFLRASPIVVTIGTNIVILGIAQALVGGEIVYNSDPAATALVNGRPLGIPFIVIVFLILVLVAHILLSQTMWGRWVLVVGGNYDAAAASGVPVKLVRFGTFVLTAALAGLCGCLLALSLQSVRPVIGSGYDFDAFAAVVVGGISLLGGAGTIARVMGGLVVVQLLSNLMVLHGLPTAAQGLAKGAVIVLAVALDIKLRQRAGRG